MWHDIVLISEVTAKVFTPLLLLVLIAFLTYHFISEHR